MDSHSGLPPALRGCRQTAPRLGCVSSAFRSPGGLLRSPQVLFWRLPHPQSVGGGTVGCTAWPALSGPDLPSSPISATSVSGCQCPRAMLIVGCGLCFLGACDRCPESAVGSAEGILSWPSLRSSGCLEATVTLRAWHPGAQAGWAVRAGPRVWASEQGRPVWRLVPMWPVELNLMASVSVPLGRAWRSWWGDEACGLRARLFRKARDPAAWQWGRGPACPLEPALGLLPLPGPLGRSGLGFSLEKTVVWAV